MTSTGKHWSRRKSMRPDEILAAAAEEVSKKGHDGLRVAAVAARAGVAKGTIYLYYRSRQQLLEALREAGVSGRPCRRTSDRDCSDDLGRL
ncbi:TetR family transcriptional regulator [Rhizomicrobium electricum]|jgi:AcrR family transcriptional regulator|uniref:HTH tetR-type domain-containing protein n=1 Tax=Rhizomicrobium electricum TaxID=480070 RepID=A0ABN1ESF1_9PROT|nr:TetR family transcriptional regulator [Rhizomicrobium electricum]NIJ49073.1 AcrR family transcriptional regulator [Rhizomicrobium electricum]